MIRGSGPSTASASSASRSATFWPGDPPSAQSMKALSGKLLRTAYYPKWKKVYSESRKADIYYPEEIRMFDEVEKANQTLVVIKTVDLRQLEQNMFTKAWLESKSR